MKIEMRESRYSNETDFIDVLEDYAGRKVVEMIESIADETDPLLVKVRADLIKELKREFGYKYVL